VRAAGAAYLDPSKSSAKKCQGYRKKNLARCRTLSRSRTPATVAAENKLCRQPFLFLTGPAGVRGLEGLAMILLFSIYFRRTAGQRRTRRPAPVAKSGVPILTKHSSQCGPFFSRQARGQLKEQRNGRRRGRVGKCTGFCTARASNIRFVRRIQEGFDSR
jgi:hypothetical protein